MCSGFEEGLYVRLIDFLYDSTLGFRVIKKKKKNTFAKGGRALIRTLAKFNYGPN